MHGLCMFSLFLQLFLVTLSSFKTLTCRELHFHTNTGCVDRLLYRSSEILNTHRCSVSVVGICLQTFSSLPELSYHVFECRDCSLRPSLTHTHTLLNLNDWFQSDVWLAHADTVWCFDSWFIDFIKSARAFEAGWCVKLTKNQKQRTHLSFISIQN